MSLTKLFPLAALFALAGMAPALQSEWSTKGWSAILTRYAAGDYAGAIGAIEAIDTVAFMRVISADAPENALTNWERAAVAWTRESASPTTVRHRQLITATVALEIMRAHPHLLPPLRLFLGTWACQVVRSNRKGTDAERLWYLASIAVMQE